MPTLRVNAMNPLLADWLKKRVHIVLRTNSPVTMDGVLVFADATGVILEMLKGQSTLQMFLPWCSILHLDLVS